MSPWPHYHLSQLESPTHNNKHQHKIRSVVGPRDFPSLFPAWSLPHAAEALTPVSNTNRKLANSLQITYFQFMQHFFETFWIFGSGLTAVIKRNMASFVCIVGSHYYRLLLQNLVPFQTTILSFSISAACSGIQYYSVLRKTLLGRHFSWCKVLLV